MPTPADLEIESLGPCRIPSPLGWSTVSGDGVGNYVAEGTRVLSEIVLPPNGAGPQPDFDVAFERAGAREKVFFDPARSKAAIVTCGGLCPGMNNVIRSAFFQLTANYGVPEVLGIRYGFRGLTGDPGAEPIPLTGDLVEDIHGIGGTVLGTSRGPQKPAEMVEFMHQRGINMVLCVGGDGTQRGAHALVQEIKRRDLEISVIGIPKTIDNDIAYVTRSFGFTTAIEKAKEHLTCAHNEARGIAGGIGLVKLMGREAGFIAAAATLASGQVNVALIPEIPFRLEGEKGLLAWLKERILRRNHALVVVAEGAGQDLVPGHEKEYDASGNPKLADIGSFLKTKIEDFFAQEKIKAKVKYFDPSYHIRSVPANCDDAMLCDDLARRAVHAAMAGKTDMLVGLMHNLFVHVPLPLVTREKKRVDPESDLWMGVLANTGQEK